ncbi:Sec-independent protein translocase subunit TatA [Corynebacterium halotolerans]|uniref:Sec-independent protein translocase subunit TatA n=1 Tax=Corynebacterium halotolerans TaxID=225326 RepID=UPI003CE6BAD8
MTGIGPAQLLIIALIVVVLFGAKRLPDAARSIGRSLRIFKSEIKELDSDPADTPRN